MYIVDMAEENVNSVCDNAFEEMTSFQEMLDEMASVSPQEFYDKIKKELEVLVDSKLDQCREDEICPECGAHLVYTTYGGTPTYVPYGDTYVEYDDGGHLVCESCGYSEDD